MSRRWNACSSASRSREKKTVRAAEQSPEARETFLNDIADLSLSELVCLDESGFNTAMTRTYGRAPRGQRVQASVPRNTGKNLTLLCALSLSGSQAELVIEGAVDGEVFETYIEKVLCPTLKAGQTVLMDNLSSHKRASVRTLIEAQGCKLLYLPPYSPDFNPIEMLFSKLKAFMRQAGERTKEKVIAALGLALARISQQDILGWCQHALPLLSL